MPRRDGTGPNGLGALTGKRMGYCGKGSGSGQGNGYGRYGQAFPETKEDLSREKDLLEQRIKDIDKKLENK